MSYTKNTYAEIALSELPLVVVVVVGSVNDESFPAYLEELLEAIQSRQRVVIRMHAGPLTVFPPRFVQMSVAWMKVNKEILNSHVVAVSIVMKHSALRMATQAMVWAGTPPFPIVAASDTAEADIFLQAQLAGDKG